MSTSELPARDAKAARDRRRKRKERAASHALEPKNVVSGAGQPLDLSVRRDLEEQLGHDLSRIRLHTDRTAGALTDMLGADAVAVGQDIFFREGTFRPGTVEGRRLLAHELLHTVQNPDGLGALRAGRDLGAVSLPQQAIEREAESTAQELADPARAADAPAPAAQDVEPGRATPGWLRYATVDADRSRQDMIDPATLVDRMANQVLRSLRSDPSDFSKRTRLTLARMPVEMQDAVLARLERRLLTSEQERLEDLLAENEDETRATPDNLPELNSHDAPAGDPDLLEELQTERETERENAEAERARRERVTAAGPSGAASGVQDGGGAAPESSGGAGTSGSGRQQDEPSGSSSQGGTSGGAGSSGTTDTSPGGPTGAQGPSGGGPEADAGASGGGAGSESSSAEQDSGSGTGQQASEQQASGQQSGEDGGAEAEAGGEKKENGQQSEDAVGGGQDEQGVPTASQEESAAKNRPGAVDPLVAGQQIKEEDRRGVPDVPATAPGPAGPSLHDLGAVSTLDGARAQDLDGGEEDVADDDPFGRDADADSADRLDENTPAEASAWDIKLGPDDFLPQTDLDVSGVPTADQFPEGLNGAAPLPTFPQPPPTRAEEVQAQRAAEDAEDAVDDAPPETEGTASLVGTGESVDGPAGRGPRPEGPVDDAATAPGTALPALRTSPDAATGTRPDLTGTTPREALAEQAGGNSGDAKKDTAEQAKKAADPGQDQAGGGQQGEGGGGAGGGREAQGAPEKAQQQDAGGAKASGGTEGAKDSGKAESEGQSATGQGSAGSAGTANGPQSPSPARDGHVSGASGAASSGGGATESTGTAGSAEVGGSSGTGTSAPSVASAPSTKASSSSTGTSPSADSPSRPATTAAPPPSPAPEAEPADRHTASPAPKAALAPRGGGVGGGPAPAGKGKAAKKDTPVPNLSQVSPEAGLATAAKLKPHKALEALGGVSGSVDRTVGDEHKSLASAPPSMDRPAGAPRTLEGSPRTDAPGTYSQDPAQKADAPEGEEAEVTGDKKPEGDIPAEKADDPGGWDMAKMAVGYALGWLGHAVGLDIDPSELAAKFAGLPTKDEALKQAQVGNAPGVQMQGGADSAAGEQDGSVDAKGQEAHTDARDDAGRNMGEDQVYPNAPKEQLQAKVPGQEGKGGGAPAAGGAVKSGQVPVEAVSEVGEHERGPQLTTAFAKGQQGLAEGHKKKDKDTRQAQDQHRTQVGSEVSANTGSQSAERDKAMSEVTDQREQWRAEQDKHLADLGSKKSEKHDKLRKDVKDKEDKTDKDVKDRKDTDDKDVQDKATKAESDADQKKEESKNDSGNWVSKAWNWIKDKFREIKEAIVGVFRRARDAVVNLIKNFKDTVIRWINEARKWIVDTIKGFIDALIELGKALVRAIVELANRIRQLITNLVKAAIALVQRLANALKQALKDLLDALGKILSAILDVLKQLLDAAIKAVVDLVKSVMDFAMQLLGNLGKFIVLVGDIISDPGGWISNLGSSAKDGAQHHLFPEVASAVKQWFNEKIQEIIGVPKAIFQKLINGGISKEEMAKEAWDAVLPQLPLIIGEIVITKIVAKLIPGAGWVLAIIDFLQTAWGALSAIMRAFTAFMDFLLAVKKGNAGVMFAKAVAAGVVALLESLYQWLLSSIGKYVRKVGKRLRGVAAKLGKDRGGKGGPGRGGADSAGSDDKGSGKKDGERPADHENAPGAPRPTSSAPTSTTPSRPRPGEPAPHTPVKDNAPGRPKPSPDPKKPPASSKDKNGKPKKSTDEDTDTRPTPTAKPNPKKPEPPARPRTEPKPDTTPDPAKPKAEPDKSSGAKNDPPGNPKEAAPGKPKGETPQRPKGTEETPGTNRPKSEEPGRPKQAKDADEPKKPRNGKEEDPKRPRSDEGDPKRPKHGDDDKPRKPKPDEHAPRHPGSTPGKEGPGRPKKEDDKDKRRREEEARKEKRLAEIVARIRPVIRNKLAKGMSQEADSELLERLRVWYRLTRLAKIGRPEFEIEATLNPTAPVTNGYTAAEDLDANDYIERTDYLTNPPDPKFPSPRTPNFINGVLAKNFKAQYLNTEFVAHGQKANSNLVQEPIGFRYINKYDLNTDSSNYWVRMHLLTERLGGPFLGSNLVPARNPVNTGFKREIERYPEEEARREDATRNDKMRMVWYKIDLTWHQSTVKGFPHSITATWGTYRYNKQANEWTEKTPTNHGPTTRTTPPLEQPPAPTAASLIDINHDSAKRMQRMLNVSGYFTSAIRYVRNHDGDGSPALAPLSGQVLADRLNKLPDKRKNRIKDFRAGIVALAAADQDNQLKF